MTKRTFHSTSCELCGSSSPKDYEVLYPANYQGIDVTTLFSARRMPDQIHYQLVRCKNDSQVRSNPVLSYTTLSLLYRESEFNYQHEVKNLSKTYLKVIEKVLKQLSRDDNILEIGCGNGFVLSELKTKGFTNVFGVEPSQLAIAEAEKTLQKNIVKDMFSAKLFPKKRFKFIFVLQTLDHIPDPVTFLKDCYAILEPNGFILSYHHNVESWSSMLLGEKSPIFDIEHTYLYSHRTSQLLFEKVGFKVNQIFSPLNSVSFFHLLWLTPIPRSLKEKLLKNLFLEKMFQNINVQIPLGNSCLIAQKT